MSSRGSVHAAAAAARFALLPYREVRILQLRDDDGLSRAEVAAQLRVTEARVRQIERQARTRWAEKAADTEVNRLREELIARRLDAGELVRCESCRMTEDVETATESWAHSSYDGTWECADCFHDDGEARR